MVEAQDTNYIIAHAEVKGGLILPALLATGCGLYKMASLPWPTTNGQLLFIFGLLASVGSALGERRPTLTWLAAPLGFYTFGVIGCAAIGLAIAERSGIWVLSVAGFWTVFGWYVLGRMKRARLFYLNRDKA